MSEIKDKVILITGGASGIGRLMGQMVLEQDAKLLIIWDVNAENLHSIQAEFAKFKHRLVSYNVDVSDTSVIRSTFHEMTQNFGSVDIVINNAGVVVGRSFASHSHEEIDRTMQINASAYMHIALEALVGMQKRGSGHIVNIASAAGMVSNPNMAVYCASKWAVIGWSDSLRLELEQSHPGIKVTTVTPYYIDTGMFHGVHSPFIPLLKPEPTARKIIQAIRSNRVFLRMPLLIYLLPLLRGLMPVRLFDLVVGRALGVYSSMDTFKGKRP